MPKVLVAPTAFKGTLSPQSVADAIEHGLKSRDGDIEAVLIPLADGGDGTLEAVYRAAGGTFHDEQTLGPTGQPVFARWLQLKEESLVELATTCGIATLSAGQLDAMGAHTYGLGQIISRCFEFGMKTINIAVGGSASTDGGMGALRALGATFFDEAFNEVESLGGAALNTIRHCDLTGVRWLTKETKLRVLTDVTNPLLGTNGAAAIFAPQKGANQQQVKLLEEGLRNFADVLDKATETDRRDTPGAGAAGGTAFGLAAALDAEITSGFDWIASITQLESKIAQSDLVITGEGRFDEQSLSGKVIGELVKLCKKQGKPLYVVAGSSGFDTAPNDVEGIIVPTAAHGMCNGDDIARAVCSDQYLRF